MPPDALMVSNAVFRLDADGCADGGAITAAVNTAHIYMNCANSLCRVIIPEGIGFVAMIWF